MKMVQMIHVVIDSYLIIVMFYRFASAKKMIHVLIVI